MDPREPEPDVPPSQIDRHEFHLTSTSSHHLRLSIAIILTILHFTPIVIRNPQNPNTIIFAQPYLTKWLIVPYAAYYMRTSKLLLTGQQWHGPLVTKKYPTSAIADDLVITEPRTIIRNLRVGIPTYRLCGAVVICDVSWLCATDLIPKMWNSLPPYAVGQWKLELQYLVAGVVVLVTLLLGSMFVLGLVFGSEQELSEDAKALERLCVEMIEQEERDRKGKKEP